MKAVQRNLTSMRKFNTNVIRQRSTKAISSSDLDVDDGRPFEEIPGPRGVYDWPVIGPALHFKPFTNYTALNVHLLYKDLLDKYGPLVRCNMGIPTVLVADPFDIEVVMKSEGKYPNRILTEIHQLYCKKHGLRRGIPHIQGEEWQQFRSPVNPRMMRVKSAQYYLPAQNEVADHLVSRMKKEKIKPEDLLELFFRYACESISVVAFNKRLGYLDEDIERYPEKLQAMKDIQTLFENLMKSLNVPPFILKYFPLKLKRDYFDAATGLFSTVQKYYHSAMEEIEQRKAEGKLETNEHNFMVSLMTTDKLTSEQMSVIALDLFGAGTDSTARNLQMMLYNLARNPDKQQKLHEEIQQVIGPSGPLTMDALTKMPYLLACLRESFRVSYPTMAGTQRFLPNDIVLQGYRIPAGTSISLMNQRTVMNPKYFPDPESFIPERWMRDDEGKRETPIPTSALLPFGFGPRQCLGKRFAEQEIYLAITKMIQNFEVSLEPGHEEVEVFYRIFIGTKNPIRFHFEIRN